ncbi:MAG: hypothetical protein U0V70_13570 [Terriglobia bacterium]
MSEFHLTKSFDPVWYFYIFWFPEYLKRARHFDFKRHIGRYAWIPFAFAFFGNILGGWVVMILLRLKLSLTAARKSSVTLFALLMLSAIPAVLVESDIVSIGQKWQCWDTRPALRICWFFLPMCSPKMLSVRFGTRQYGLDLRHGLRPAYRLGGRSLLLRACLHWVRSTAPDLRFHPLDSGATTPDDQLSEATVKQLF